MSDPLHQFLIQVIYPISFWGVDISFTNASLFMLIGVSLILGVLITGLSSAAVTSPSLFQYVVEAILGFAKNLTDDIIGAQSTRLAPLVFGFFFFIATINLLGIVPFSYTVTSQFVVTLALAIFMFIVATGLGLMRHGFRFFKRFMPSGVPLVIAPIIIPIEVISYMFRPISLGVRLFANMFAGHIVLKIFAGFSVGLGLVGIIPMFFNVLFMLFEIFVACLQAYIFTILSCVYIHDAREMH
ncbi:MAG: F0F1 ATP synthase subunit A [Alphaproteobacteria bacterium]|nr:MAG: F0F1 ATP synthase subunit A [Alphaproteobacteria bacterium]